MVQYNCKGCQYSTTRKSNFQKHCDSKRHQMANENFSSSENDERSSKNDELKLKKVHKKAICDTCDKFFFNKVNLRRHKKICRGLIDEKDKLLEQILQEKNEIEKKLHNAEKERDKITKENAKLGYQLACAKNESVVFNSNYVLNVFTDAHNIEDLLKKKLTDGERKYIEDMGALGGSYKLLENRCIEGVSVSKRPFHCVDDSRNKFLLHTNNEWVEDKKGTQIAEKVSEAISPLYPIDVKDVKQKIKNCKVIADLKSDKHNKKMINELKFKTNLKNNVKPILTIGN